MNKNEIRQLNSIQSNTTCYNILKELVSKNMITNKESNISSNKNFNPIKNKSISSNQISNSNFEETNSKNTVKIKIKKEKEKSIINKKKRRKKDKMANFLKNNEKLKIPIGKRRRSSASKCIKLNFNNFNNNFNESDIANPLTTTIKKNIRTDKNGIEINKNNKKKFHITFLDDISPNNQITETVNIESFKQYNIVKKNPCENNLQKCNCCIIF